MIRIGKPYIEIDGNKARLAADIRTDNFDKKMFFEVDECYKDYLCTEVGDAFLVGLLNYAFATGQDIESEAPISERLLYQIKTYFLPVMPEARPKTYKPISIEADAYKGKIETRGCVGTSASGGVDSFYSICKHVNNTYTKYNLTHLLIANQFNIYNDEKEVREQFKRLVEDTKKIPANYNLELVTIYTNHHEFLFDGFVQEYSLRICSYVLALQKLFGVYYVSSGVPIKLFEFANHDSDGFDVFNLSVISNDQVTFYSSGGEVARTEKIKYIADDKFVQKSLKVCNDNEQENCGKCEKCMRTMLSLDIVGKLEAFDQSFPIEKFRQNKNSYLSLIEGNYIESSIDLLDSIKRYGYRVPISSVLMGRICYRFAHNIKEMLKKWNWLREIYFNLKIDFIIYGSEKAKVYRYGTKYEIKEAK